MTEFTIITVDKGASTEITREKFLLDQQGITNWLISKNIIKDTEMPLPTGSINNDRQEMPVKHNLDRVIILTEIRTIIAKMYAAGEPLNHQP